MISTLALILSGIVAVVIAGFGPTLLLMERRAGRSRAIAIPAIGLACYIVATHFLASLHFAGGVVSIGALIILGALGLFVPRNRRLDIAEIRDSLAIFVICGIGLLLAAWPLLREGYSSYLAFGNADAAFNSGVNELMLRYGYAGHQGIYPSFWPGPTFGRVFGAGYICVLIAAVTGVDVLKLHDVVTAGMVFVVPASTFLFSLACLKASRRAALIAAAAAALSSQVCYTFYLQSFGAITFIALLPAFLAVCTEALDGLTFRQTLLAGLLFAGASFGYSAAFAVMVLMLLVLAGVALAKRQLRFKDLWWPLAIFVIVPLATYPRLMAAIFRISILESGSSRLVASLKGPEVLLSFAFALTDQYVPFFWGTTMPTLAANSIFEPPSLGYLAVFGLAALVSAFVFWSLIRPRSTVQLATRIQLTVLSLAIIYFVYRRNGYGAFKLAAWLNPLFLAFLVCSVVPGPAFSEAGKWYGRARHAALLALLCLNVGWAVELGISSLPTSTGASGKSMAGFTAYDFAGLDSLRRIAPADAPILVAIPDSVVQRWAITYLRRRNISAVPYLSLSPDEPDSAESTAAEGADAARYILTWSKSEDIVSTSIQQPVWQDAKFQVAPLDSIRDLLMIGRGWYRTEHSFAGTGPWQRQFRWLRSRGEMILLNGSGQEMRLRLTIVPGYGLPSPERSISFALNGIQFDQIRTSGTANVITKPFRATAFMNRLSISLPDNAEPIPSRWALFRHWVPKDGRRLNIAVSNVSLLSAREYSAMRAPCRLDFALPDSWDALGLGGLYGDRWIAGEAHVLLQPCGDADSVLLDGLIPALPRSPPPFPLIVSVDGSTRTLAIAKPGPFSVWVPLPEGPSQNRPYEITVRTPRTFVPSELGLGPDRRRLSLRLNVIQLQRSAPSPAGSRQ
ncbi:MAG: hypothetical protein ACLQVN_04190 [Bryobacteraceae bacterium]